MFPFLINFGENMSKIFISYRREDSRGVTGRIYDRLENQFGQERIFMDVDTIQPGMDFVSEIEHAVDASDLTRRGCFPVL